MVDLNQDQEKKKVVVIEDDKALIEALTIHLKKDGFEVLSATDGQMGLELVNKEKPNIVLLDLVMPRINGFEVLRVLKGNIETKEIPVIVLTNLGQDEDVKKGAGLGAETYIVKATTDLGHVTEEVNKVLNETS